MEKKLKLIFSEEVKEEFKRDLPRSVQDRFSMDIEFLLRLKKPLSKTKPIEGLGKEVKGTAVELIKNGQPAYRCVYVIKGGALYILHAFSKTSDDLPKKNKQIIKLRYSKI